jgi:hypothetical protein
MTSTSQALDEEICVVIDRRADDREIILSAFFVNGLCWFGLLYGFGAF